MAYLTAIPVPQIRNLQTLSAVYAHKNIAFIGPTGTGKTHLAKAFGYECCNHGLRSPLRTKFKNIQIIYFGGNKKYHRVSAKRNPVVEK